jgi:hypothetical protein
VTARIIDALSSLADLLPSPAGPIVRVALAVAKAIAGTYDPAPLVQQLAQVCPGPEVLRTEAEALRAIERAKAGPLPPA